MRLLVDGGLPIAGGIVGAGMDEVRWPTPVRPGETLHLRSEVLEVRPSKSRPDRGMAKVRVDDAERPGRGGAGAGGQPGRARAGPPRSQP